MRAWIAGVVVALAVAAPCAAAPAPVAGWPVPARSGLVLEGPGGGAAVTAQGLIDPHLFTVAAYRPDGRRRWVSTRGAGCGNCDSGNQPVRRQADGTYGPIGYTGDDYWAVTPAGRVAAGCAGVVLTDGTCIAAEVRFPPPSFAPENSLVARRGAAVLWMVVEPDLDWVPEGNEPPTVVRDGGGTIYTAYGQGGEGARLVAVDSRTGAVRVRVPGTLDLVAATQDAGLAREGRTGPLVAVGPDGTRRWSAALLPSFLFSQNVIVDRARGRIHVGQTRSGRWRTTALAADTGQVVWRSPTSRSVKPLSLATGGLLLASVQQGSTRSLQALGPDGRARWTFRTAGPVVGARELADRTVVVSTETSTAIGRGPLWRIDPLRRPSPSR